LWSFCPLLASHRGAVVRACRVSLFVFNETAPTEIYTLSLHDALPISMRPRDARRTRTRSPTATPTSSRRHWSGPARTRHVSPSRDRKSTRLNSSHVKISYAVFCLKKKNKSSQERQ